jgi:hypothetical protein
MAQLRKVVLKIRLRCGARRPGNLDAIFNDIYIGSEMQVPRNAWQCFFYEWTNLIICRGLYNPQKGLKKGGLHIPEQCPIEHEIPITKPVKCKKKLTI